MILSWFTLFLCIFSTFGNENQGDVKNSRILDYKEVHPSLKIINGQKTSVTRYPFIASLQVSQSEFGSAVIIGKKTLLTTAFNVAWMELSDLQFRVGSNSYFKQGQVLKASKVIIHPNYTGSWDYDIAVIQTDKPIKSNKKVKPIKLGSEELEDSTPAFVAGWGMSTVDDMAPSDILLEAKVRVWDWNACGAEFYNGSLTPRLMCTTSGPCVYDFGDPLVANDRLYGLYAGSDECLSGLYPALYTDVVYLADWIKNVTSTIEEHA